MTTTESEQVTNLAQVIHDIRTVDAYIRVALGHGVPITKHFDPVLALLTLHNAALDLLEATGGTVLPEVPISTRSGYDAVRGARTQLVATGNRIVEILNAEHTPTTQRRLLATTLPHLRDAHQQLFGTNW